MNDETISGWMGGGFGSLPETAHPIWGKLYDCILECPAYRSLYSDIPIRSPQDGDTTLEHRKYLPKLSMIAQYDSNSRKARCQKPCPIEIHFDISHRVYRVLGKMLSVYGQIPRENFKEWFFEANFRVNTRFDNIKYRGAEPWTFGKFLAVLEKEPL
ncbi:MAG: hypothetical protein AAFR51_03905 [Pseudomonadota bacterium]